MTFRPRRSRAGWRMVKGMENALKANPQDVREQYERQLKDLEEAYGEAMLALRARKNCSPYWARTRSDRVDPPGASGRRHNRLDQQVVSVVRDPMAHRVVCPEQLRFQCAAGCPGCRYAMSSAIMAASASPA